MATAARETVALLEREGFKARWLRREHTIYSAEISKGDEQTKLEWVVDSDFRYFPAVPDHQFGFVLHPVDLAINKLMAAVGRREPRDLFDLLQFHKVVLPLGAIIWAATSVAPGFTPEGLIAELRRNTRYAPGDFASLRTETVIRPEELNVSLAYALADAELFVAKMPTEFAGMLFLRDGEAVQPEPTSLSTYIAHAPQRRGHWPSGPTSHRR